MGRHKAIYLVMMVMSVVVLAAMKAGEGSSELNPSLGPSPTVIAGQDHRLLKAYFSRPDTRTDHSLAIPVGTLLLSYMSPVCGRGQDAAKYLRSGDESPRLRLLFLEKGKEEAPTQALFACRCLPETMAAETEIFDDRLVSLVVDKDSSRLSVLTGGRVPDDCDGPVQIRPSKEVRMGGKSLVGLAFSQSNGASHCSSAARTIAEERINFFLLDEQGAKPAGSVLKSRKEVVDNGRGDITREYEADLVFKKDMKGNIVGILMPYTIKKNGSQSEKGMFRFSWDTATGEFVRE
jgi:hypothetical protein